MSGSAGKKAEPTEREALTRLEAAVGRLIDRCEALEARAAKAEKRTRDLDGLLKQFKKGDTDPAELQEAVSGLQAETAELRTRLSQGREGVDRLISRLRFLEDH